MNKIRKQLLSSKIEGFDKIWQSENYLYIAHEHYILRAKTTKNPTKKESSGKRGHVVESFQEMDTAFRKSSKKGKVHPWDACFENFAGLNPDFYGIIKTVGMTFVSLGLVQDLLSVFKKIEFLVDVGNPFSPIFFCPEYDICKRIFGADSSECQVLVMPCKPKFEDGFAYQYWARDHDGIYSLKRLWPSDVCKKGSKELQTGLFLMKTDKTGKRVMNEYICDDCEQDKLPHEVTKNVPHGDGTTRMECTNCNRWSGHFVPAEY